MGFGHNTHYKVLDWWTFRHKR